MRNKLLLVGLVFLLLISVSSALPIQKTIPFNIQVTDLNDNPLPGTYTLQFNISLDSSCSNVLYTNITTQTTSSQRAIINYTIANVNLNFTDQYFICYYRDGTLKEVKQTGISPYAGFAFETNNSQCWNGLCNVSVIGNESNTAINYTGNLYFNKTQIQNNQSSYLTINAFVSNLTNYQTKIVFNYNETLASINDTGNRYSNKTENEQKYLNKSGTNANQDVDINPYTFKSYGIRIGANATRYGDTYTIQNVITQNKTVTSYGNIKWSVFSAIADSYGSQPYAGIHELINDSNTGAISYAITSTRLGVSGLSFAINPEDEFGGLGFPIRISRLTDDGSGANFQVNGGISTNSFLNVSANIEASSYSVGGVVGVSCAGDVSTSQNGIVTGCVSSDQNLKKDIVEINESQTNKLIQLKVYNFNRTDEYYDLFPNEKREQHTGFLTQELALIFPEAVKNSSILVVVGNKTIISNRTLQNGSIESYNKTVAIIEPKYFETVSTYPIIVGLVKGFQEQATENKLVKDCMKKSGTYEQMKFCVETEDQTILEQLLGI